MVVFFAPSIRALAYGTCNNSSSGIHYSSPLCQHIHQKLQTLPYIQLHIHHGRKTPFRYQKTTKYLQTGGEVSEAGNCSIHCGVYETKGERCMDCSLGLSEALRMETGSEIPIDHMQLMWGAKGGQTKAEANATRSWLSEGKTKVVLE